MQASDTAFEELQGAAGGVLDPTARTVLWPALGGMVTGIVALGCPEVLYQVSAHHRQACPDMNIMHAPALDLTSTQRPASTEPPFLLLSPCNHSLVPDTYTQCWMYVQHHAFKCRKLGKSIA